MFSTRTKAVYVPVSAIQVTSLTFIDTNRKLYLIGPGSLSTLKIQCAVTYKDKTCSTLEVLNVQPEYALSPGNSQMAPKPRKGETTERKTLEVGSVCGRIQRVRSTCRFGAHTPWPIFGITGHARS